MITGIGLRGLIRRVAAGSGKYFENFVLRVKYFRDISC